MLIIQAAITIQRFARGFITRLKVRKVYKLQMEFEKARLDDALAQMQAMIEEQAKNVPPTPAKEEPTIVQTSAKLSSRKEEYGLHDSAIPDDIHMQKVKQQEEAKEDRPRIQSPPEVVTASA